MTDERERMAEVMRLREWSRDMRENTLGNGPDADQIDALVAGFGDVAAERARRENAEKERDEALSIISARSEEASDARFAEQDMREERDALQSRIDAASKRGADLLALVLNTHTGKPWDEYHEGLGFAVEEMLTALTLDQPAATPEPPISTNAFIDFKSRAENSGEKILENDV